ncbi:MAG: ethanolamine utilization protein EutJ [Anaerolineaceae bacterium]
MTAPTAHPNGLAVEETLARAEQVILRTDNGSVSAPPIERPEGRLLVGVDLGTAYLVVVVLDEQLRVVAGEYQFAQVVRDGLVVDFIKAVDLILGMKASLQKRLRRDLTHAASGYPPGVPRAEIQATEHVLESAGLECVGLIDEPSAANQLLGIRDGAIVDVGGGTTGIAVLKNGKVIYTADEATGGTHFSLVIAGALDIPFEEAEKLKINPNEQKRLFPTVRPVMEKVGSIVARHVKGRDVPSLTLVGGSTCFPGMAEVVQEYTGIPTTGPDRPLFVTPIGIAIAARDFSNN